MAGPHPSLPAGLREEAAIELSLHFKPEGGWCLHLCAGLWCTSIGCVAMQEAEPESRWPHRAHLFISSCIQYGINTSSSGKASALFNPPNSSPPLSLIFLFLFPRFHLRFCPLTYLIPAFTLATSITCIHRFSYLYMSLIRHGKPKYIILLQILQLNPNSVSLLIMYWSWFHLPL